MPIQANIYKPACGDCSNNGLSHYHTEVIVYGPNEECGYAQARHEVMVWVPGCEALWEQLREEEAEQAPYDWEHCPKFLAAKLDDWMANRGVAEQ